MIDCNNNFFHLYNEKISYLFYVMPNHQLGHLYYGKNLGQLSQGELEYLADHSNRGAEITEYDPKMKDFSLGDRMQEYPVFGTSDFREGALDIKLGQEQVYPDFKYDHYEISRGKKRNESYPASYGDDAENLIIYLKDEDHGLDLKLTYSIFSDVAAVVRKAEIHNYSDQQYFIENMQSGVLDLPESNYDFLQLSGAWIKERHIRRRPLEQGITKVESLRGATSHQANPFVALVDKNVSNDHGEIFASNLIYSGNFVSQVQVDEWHTSRLMTGVNPQYFTWQLDSGENFAVPEAVLFYTPAGYNGLMQETHTFAKKHVIAQKWLHEKRPIVINNWEATYFDFDEEKLMRLARKAKEVGIECFVLDDGWFGKRDNDHSSLGNWTINRKKFPLGLEHFSKQIHELGMQFGLWFEPEMVSADAPIYQKHPEWVVRHPYQRASIGRNQYVLDFANPEVVNNIFNQMKTVIEKAKVDFVKWDMNRHITEAYSAYLAQKKRPQGEFYYRYILGVYDLYHKLLNAFPDLLIEGCASGGGRYDLGIMYYSPQIWPSDDSDAGERLDIMSGTLLAYPLSTFSNHVSAVPNHQTGRKTSLTFRQNFNSFGPLGYELDLNKLSDDELTAIKNHITWYKEKRDLLVNGQFDQLLPIGDEHNTYAWSVSNDDEQVVGFYRKLAKPNETLDHYLKLKNVDFKADYQIRDHVLKGKFLAEVGLRLPYQLNGWNQAMAQLAGDFQSYIYDVKKI
ncbi:alpha-galactosidase [Lactobacillus ultunensis]|uniref:Alpha-galactosidase n=1 Tax=Lactobacillus ultunensis DSM 16047 TaxID=525365 RepID=C2EN43_9LACO|nr:alpha-galactosidase [Lactobacillus ultunensis]EEJ72039.1 alpha-galactosidase [Lactobacillus ultunensis DSM 16047]QQP29584.1 alpha-galactosidase [Lactobacillus ultunensis]